MRKTLWMAWLLPPLAAACGVEDNPPSASEGTTEVAAAAVTLTRSEAIRFLERASFGPTPAAIDDVLARGTTAWIDDQLALPATSFSATSTRPIGRQFFERAVAAPDQLRLRVAFALSQILVVSENQFRGQPDGGRAAMAGYLNVLVRGALGDFRTLLLDVTLNPAMGNFLSMVHNNAVDRNGVAVAPNENYAREILQLFSLGTYLLRDNGTLLLDPLGQPQSSYSEAQIEAFAHTFTGWAYATAPCPGRGRRNPAGAWDVPMIGCDVNHDSSAQLLLDGFRTTAGAGAAQHMNEAIDNVARHRNVAPFIVKQLIQHLVTSNPSGAYVRRVVDVFRDDGTRRYGNLAAVVRAILTDREATAIPATQVDVYGHLLSPALIVTNVVRRLDGRVSDGTKLDEWSALMGQDVPAPPSVFSYYQPGTYLPGSSSVLAPEFGIVGADTDFARANFLNALLFRGISGVRVDLSPIPITPASATVAWVSDVFTHGTMRPEVQTAITNALIDRRVPDARKAALAAYLAAISPDFQLQR